MDLKNKVKESKEKAKVWFEDNKGNIIYGLYVAVCIGAVVSPMIRRSRKNRQELKRERTIYDPSLGFYWETKRGLTNNQKMIFEQRRRNGESCGKILKDMGVLKK